MAANIRLGYGFSAPIPVSNGTGVASIPMEIAITDQEKAAASEVWRLMAADAELFRARQAAALGIPASAFRQISSRDDTVTHRPPTMGEIMEPHEN